MLAKVYSSSLLGIDAYTVEVEVDLARGLPRFNIVGLPDVAVKEVSSYEVDFSEVKGQVLNLSTNRGLPQKATA